MKSSDARLRALGVRLSWGRAELLNDILAMAKDTDPLVARTVAVEAGRASDFQSARVRALVNIAGPWSSKDDWIRQTVASADRSLLEKLCEQMASAKQIDLRLLRHLVERIAMQSPQNSAAFVIADGTRDSNDSFLNLRQIELLKSWVRGLKKSRQSVSKVMTGLPENPKAGLQTLVSRLMDTALETMVPADQRAACLLLAADFEV